MKIKTVVSYHFDGEVFPNLSDVKTHVENRLGRIIDNAFGGPICLTFEQKLVLLDMLVDNKEELVDLLSITFEEDDPEAPAMYGPKEVNILDF